MCTYLARRNSTYYFRRVIPAELRPALGGKSEFMLSLRTKDRAEAKRLIPAKTAQTDALLDQARLQMGQISPAGTAQSVSPAAMAYESAMMQNSLEAAEILHREEFERRMRREERAPILQRLKRTIGKSTAEVTPEEAAVIDLLREERAGRADLTEDQAREAEAVTLRAEQRRGHVSKRSINPPAANPGKMLDTDVVGGWSSERKVTEKTKDAHAAVARWFYERAGKKPVDQIARRDVLAFKDAMIAEGQSATNVNVKLQRLGTLLQWAVDNEWAVENVAKGINVRDTDKAKNKRREFDLDALGRIFASPVFTEGARPVGGKGEAAYWLPLLALFTGARLEELGQLRPQDVMQLKYPDASGEQQEGWFIRIKEDREDGLKLKNAASERDVPVHPELQRLGFVTFAADALKAKQANLFPRLKADKYGRLTAKWGEWFGPYLRAVCGVTDRRNTFHSFRHTFKHYARHAGIEEGVQRQIMGHSSGDVADQYGSGYPLHRVVAGMASYSVPGLKLPV